VALLELRDVVVRHGVIEAVRGISLTVEPGEIVSLLGANGAGKTTTLRAISGLHPPSAGSVLFEGEHVEGATSVEIVSRGLIHCPEGRQVFAGLSVEDNLKLGAYCRRREAEPLERLPWVHELFPVLKERSTQQAGTLSGGEQQMLAIGRALMAGPRCLLLDEPSLGLAPVVVERIFDVVREIVAQGVAVLLVEQNANAALMISDRAYVLEVGRVAISGKGAELLRDDGVRAAYLGG